MDGSVIRLRVPGWLVTLAVVAITTCVSVLGWASLAIVENQRALVSHSERLEYIEQTRFSPEQLRREISGFVTQREMDAVVSRLDRIEGKVDRILGGL